MTLTWRTSKISFLDESVSIASTIKFCTIPPRVLRENIIDYFYLVMIVFHVLSFITRGFGW